MASSKTTAGPSREFSGRRRQVDSPPSPPKLEPKTATSQTRTGRSAIPRPVTRRRSETRHATRGIAGDPLLGLGARHLPTAAGRGSASRHSHSEQPSWARGRAYASSSYLPAASRPSTHRFPGASRSVAGTGKPPIPCSRTWNHHPLCRPAPRSFLPSPSPGLLFFDTASRKPFLELPLLTVSRVFVQPGQGLVQSLSLQLQGPTMI